jgi:hypothetical protein
LYDGEGFAWDVQGDGSIDDGTSDAFDGGLILEVDGRSFSDFSRATLASGGRELVIGPASLAGLEVIRRVFVPSDDTYARFTEVLRNPSGSLISITLSIHTDLGSNGSTRIIETSDGDATFETSDTWIVTDDDSDGGGDPAVAHIFVTPPSSVNISGDDIDCSYTVTVPAYEEVTVTHFAVQRWQRSEAIEAARRLALGARPQIIFQDDFETCDFSRLPWRTNAGIDTSEYRSGSCAVELDPGEYLELTFTVPDGTISFYRNVDSGEGTLVFLIDDREVERWSGEPGEGEDVFVQESFPVTAGTHTFRWEGRNDCCPEIDDVVYTGAGIGGPAVILVWESRFAGGDPSNRVINFVQLSTGSARVEEDFETGWRLPWEGFGWDIADDNAHSGIYSAKAYVGQLGLEVTLDVAGALSFWIDSNCYGDLRLWVNGSEIGSWSDDCEWREVVIPLPAGTYTFVWESYDEDDPYWLDDIVLGGAWAMICPVLWNVDLVNRTCSPVNDFDVILAGFFRMADYFPIYFEFEEIPDPERTHFRWLFPVIQSGEKEHFGFAVWTADCNIPITGVFFTYNGRVVGKLPASGLRVTVGGRLELVNYSDEALEVGSIFVARVAQALPLEALNADELVNQLAQQGVELQPVQEPEVLNPGESLPLPIHIDIEGCPEPNDDFDSACRIGLPFSGQFEISPLGDQDFFTFEVSAGTRVIIDVDAEAIGSGLDSYLVLYDEDGDSIASNDDTHGLDPYLEVSLHSSGVYFIEVRAVGDHSIGPYALRVEAIAHH